MALFHHLFQRKGMTIDEFYAKPPGVQKFIMASMRIVLEAEQVVNDG